MAIGFYRCDCGCNRYRAVLPEPEPVDDLQQSFANPERVDNGCMIFRSISGATATEGDK